MDTYHDKERQAVEDTCPSRYYAESDNKQAYVVDRYADIPDRTIECDNMPKACALAARLNHTWPTKPWDTIQAKRDGWTNTNV